MVNTLKIYTLNIYISNNHSFVKKTLHKIDPNSDGVRIVLTYKNILLFGKCKYIKNYFGEYSFYFLR